MIFYSRSKYIRWMWCPFSSFRNRDGSFSYKQWRKTHGKSRIFSPTSNKMYTGILAWKVDFFPHLFHTHFSSFKKQCRKEFFQNLWKCRCNILVSFPSHLKKLLSILRFWLEKMNCGFFYSFHSQKNNTKQLFPVKISV